MTEFELLDKPWKEAHRQYAEEMTPEILFETGQVQKNQVCLVCGGDKATSGLFSIAQIKVLIPICTGCSFRMNFYGMPSVLKKIDQKTLLKNILKYKLLHWFSTPSLLTIYYNLQEIKKWSAKMKKIMKTLNINT